MKLSRMRIIALGASGGCGIRPPKPSESEHVLREAPTNAVLLASLGALTQMLCWAHAHGRQMNQLGFQQLSEPALSPGLARARAQPQVASPVCDRLSI